MALVVASETAPEAWAHAPHVAVHARDWAAWVERLKEGDVHARGLFFDAFARDVERVLARIIGHRADLDDLVHDVFLRAFAGVSRLGEPSALRSWLVGIAVITAREHLRARARRKWLSFLPTSELPERASAPADYDLAEVLACTYLALERLSVDERIVFTLRRIEGMTLPAIAAACVTSLNTVKRRLARAEKRFFALARNEPALADWLEEEGR